MRADDERHGTVAGYRAGCRNQCCTRAIGKYNELRKLAKINGLPTSHITGLGTARRLQALSAIGWSARRLAHMMGRDPAYVRHLFRNEAGLVSTTTAAVVEALFDRLSMTRPSEGTPGERQGITRALNIAAARGWLPPLAWDDIDANEPPVDTYLGDFMDTVLIERSLGGDKTALSGANRAEREAITSRWLSTGNSYAELARLSGWNVDRYKPSSTERVDAA